MRQSRILCEEYLGALRPKLSAQVWTRNGGRIALVLLICLLSAGCVVSKGQYEAQLIRTQGFEARVADLEARLAAETEQRQGFETDLEESRVELQGLKSDLEEATARTQGLDGRLSGCSEREDNLRADLDVCRKARASAEADLERSRGDLQEERNARVAETERLRAEISDLESRVALLVEEKEREEREKREKLDEISRTYEGLLEGMKEEVARGRVTISQLKGKLSVNLLDEILFDSGSASIKPEGREVLKRLGDVLAGVEDKAVVIEGHTDNVPISGELANRFPSNWELSTARATSVVRYLEEVAGISPQRLSAMGFGPYRPVASNDEPEGRLRNRRIEIKLVPLEAPLFAPPREAAGEEAPGTSSEQAAPLRETDTRE